MAVKLVDNFSFNGKKPLDARLVYNTVADLVAVNQNTIYDGICAYVVATQKFYVFNSTNTVDATLQQWRELTTAGILIQSATIDNVTTSATKGHLILTMSDGTTIDCGDAKGDKGDKGDGFAIIKLYTSISDMTSDTNPVNDGQMVGVIDSSATPLTAKVYIRNSSQTQDARGNENGYTFFCNLADATVIQGPQGPQGPQGVKGDTPVVTTQAIAATSSTPSGTKITFTTGTGSTAVSTSINVYNGKDGISVQSATINASGELVFTLSDASTINVGKIGGNGTGGCITMLGCFNTAPTTFVQNDIYYNNLDGLIYKSDDGTTWGTGTQPEKDILYISMDDHKIYSYTNNTFEVYGGGMIDISSKANNAIKNITGSTVASEDGLYVEDLSDKVNALNIAQKTVNSELEYYYATVTTSSSGVSIKDARLINYLPYLTTIISNLDSSRYDTEGVTLKKAKTYKITFGLTRQTTSGNGASVYIMDSDGNKLGNRGYFGSTSYNDSIIDTIYTPTKDISVYPALVNLNTNLGSTYYPDCSFFQITEVGRTITIDPVNYIEKSSGIETVPVGTVISYTGTDSPNHYLPCDGSIYNITDYPDLAEKIKSMYGSYNAFGGDDTTTFATPTMQTDTASSSSNGLISNYQTDGTAFTNIGDYSASSGTYTNVFNYNTTSTWFANENAQSFPVANKPCIGYEFNSPKYVNKVKITNMIFSSSYRCNDFDIEGSIDNTNWDVLLTDYLPKDTKEHEFDLTTTGIYKYYRLVFKKIPTGGTNYNWGLGKLKFYGTASSKYLIKSETTYFMRYYTGISSGEMYDEYILRTGSTETFKEFCQDIKQFENRPDLWEAGKEYNFGSGLYGLRTKGNFSGSLLTVIPASAKATNILSWGGSVTNTNGNRWALPGCVSASYYEIYRQGTSPDNPYMLQFSGSESNPVDADIWVKYVKN